MNILKGSEIRKQSIFKQNKYILKSLVNRYLDLIIKCMNKSVLKLLKA